MLGPLCFSVAAASATALVLLLQCHGMWDTASLLV